jgi:hypothetical protein
LLFEDDPVVFIVRVWLERREIESAPVECRGSIQHVTSGSITYFSDLDEIPQFTQSGLTGMGISFPESAE